MQQMLKRAKILKGSCLNGLSALKSNFTWKHVQSITKSEFEHAFSHIFGEDVDTFTRTFSQNIDTLEQQLTKETIIESNCQNAFRVLKIQFEKIFTSVLIKPSSLDGTYARNHIFGEDVDTFTRTFSQNIDTLEQQLTKETIIESNCQNAFRVLKIQFEKIFTSVLIKPSSLDGTYARKYFHAYTNMKPQLFKETILTNFDFIEKYMLKTIIHAQTIQKRLDDKKFQIQEFIVQEVKASDAISEDKAQECCMQLDNEEFQEIGSTAAFKVLDTQFQMFIKSRIYLDDEYVVMTRNYFLQYTQLEIPEFCDTLIQHMESVKKSINEIAPYKRGYDTRVNERQMETTEEKVDMSKALDASLVDTKTSGT
nr:hypothetical protein [Tanacetum cinerariifolium]